MTASPGPVPSPRPGATRRAGPAPRLVASDLDGTIVRPDGSVSGRTRDALTAAEAAGALVVFVTGRPPRWMEPVAAATGLRGLAICANGALVYDLAEHRVVHADPFAAGDVGRAAAILRDALPGAAFAAERVDLGFVREAGYVSRWDVGLESAVLPPERLLDGPVVKLLVRQEGEHSDRMLVAAQEAVGGLATVTTSTSDGLLEVSAPGVSKASGLAGLAARRGLDRGQAVAFGDMPNDLAMLGWAGHAVAVANAHPDVLAVADEVTASVEDDGVALVLERYFPVPSRRPA